MEKYHSAREYDTKARNSTLKFWDKNLKVTKCINNWELKISASTIPSWWQVYQQSGVGDKCVNSCEDLLVLHKLFFLRIDIRASTILVEKLAENYSVYE